MDQLPAGTQDTQHYILETQVPVICNDEATGGHLCVKAKTF